MASTDYDFTATRNEIIEQAYRLVGVLSPGETLSGEQISEGAFTLNQIVKSWQSEGVFLWQLASVTKDIVAETAAYLIGDDPPIVSVDKAFLVTAGTTDTGTGTTGGSSNTYGEVPYKDQYWQMLTEWAPYIYDASTGYIETAGVQTATMTVANPTVVTVTDASVTYDTAPVFFRTTGTLPTGLSTTQIYYVRNKSGNTFNVSETAAGALIEVTGAGSGTHSCAFVDIGLAAVYYDGELCMYRMSDHHDDSTTYNALADIASRWYLDYYVEPASGQVQGFRNFCHGLAERYIRQADSDAQTAISNILTNGAYVATDGGEDLYGNDLLSREVAYGLAAYIHAERADITLTTTQTNRREFLKSCAMNHCVLWKNNTGTYCRPFMAAITAHSLIDYYNYVSEDSDIITKLRDLADYIISTCWVEGPTTDYSGYSQIYSFKYTDRDLTALGHADADATLDNYPQPDLNMMIAPWFGWLYYKTGVGKYREYGDAMFEGAIPVYSGTTYVSGAYLGTRSATNPAGKQYNQQLVWGPDYFTYAEANPDTDSTPAEQPTSPTPTGETKDPLEVISWREYQGIEDKGEAGTPTHLSVTGGRSPSFYLWPVPDTDASVELYGPKKLKDWDSASGTGDFPVKFERALIYQLASDLSDLYQLPPQRLQMLQNKAQYLLTRAKNSESEGDSDQFVKGSY